MGNPYAPPPRDRPPTATPPPPAPPPRDRPPTYRPVEPGRAPAGRRGLPPEPPPEPTPEEVRAAVRPVRVVGLLSMVAFASSAFLPLPWQLAGLVLAVVAMVLGVRALRLVWSTGLRRALAAPLVIAMAFSGLVLVSSSSVLATWPIQMRHQECLERALTVSARDACEAEYREAVESYLSPGGSAAP